MSKIYSQILMLALVVFPFLGMLDSGYVSYEKISGALPVCRPPFQCAAVLRSPWINIGPVPIPFLGFIFFTTLFLLGVSQFLGVVNLSLGSKKIALSKIIFGFGMAGGGFGIYILILMAFIIKAWCLYCLLSAINCGCLFVLSFINLKQKSNPIVLE
jgi:uncharacterized membrane protein